MEKHYCPACNGELTFWHGLKVQNPWKYKCPLCGVMLEMNGFVKKAFMISALIVCLMLGVAIYLEETGYWEIDKIVIGAIVIPIGFVIEVALWPYAAFQKKND